VAAENVVELYPGTSKAIRRLHVVAPEGVAKAAEEAHLTSLALVGRDHTGQLYVASSGDGDDAIALFAHATGYLANTRTVEE